MWYLQLQTGHEPLKCFSSGDVGDFWSILLEDNCFVGFVRLEFVDVEFDFLKFISTTPVSLQSLLIIFEIYL